MAPGRGGAFTAIVSGSAGGSLIAYPWDLVERNGEALGQDYSDWKPGREWAPLPAGAIIVGPADQVLIDPAARVEPLVVLDATKGPVLIDRGAVVQAFSRLEGPCYVGADSHILGAKLRGGSIGPQCRVGGEVDRQRFGAPGWRVIQLGVALALIAAWRAWLAADPARARDLEGFVASLDPASAALARGLLAEVASGEAAPQLDGEASREVLRASRKLKPKVAAPSASVSATTTMRSSLVLTSRRGRKRLIRACSPRRGRL